MLMVLVVHSNSCAKPSESLSVTISDVSDCKEEMFQHTRASR